MQNYGKILTIKMESIGFGIVNNRYKYITKAIRI